MKKLMTMLMVATVGLVAMTQTAMTTGHMALHARVIDVWPISENVIDMRAETALIKGFTFVVPDCAYCKK